MLEMNIEGAHCQVPQRPAGIQPVLRRAGHSRWTVQFASVATASSFAQTHSLPESSAGASAATVITAGLLTRLQKTLSASLRNCDARWRLLPNWCS